MSVYIANIACQRGLQIHLYTDDTRLYILFDPSDSVSEFWAKHRLEAYIADIGAWMLANKLKLNKCKSELLIVAFKSQQAMIHNRSITIGS